MSARDFLDRLETDGLLDPSVVADLRRQVQEASRGVSAESLAKLLVDNGHLTRFQASKLINEVTAKVEQQKAAQAASLEARRIETEQKAAAAARQRDEELLLPPEVTAPATSSTPARGGPATPRARASEDDLLAPDELEPLEPAPRTAQRPSPPAGRPPASAKSATPARQPAGSGTRGAMPPPTPTSAGEDLLDEADLLTPLEDGEELDPLSDVGQVSAASAARARLKKKRLRDNPWDSPLMLVGGGSLILLLVIVYVLYSSMTRGTATEFFEAAESDYRAGAYANAIETYGKMMRRFPNDPNVGKARVKQQMAQFRMIAEGTSDPQRALDAARTILPTIENEEDFSVVREELASILPDIARGFADRARQAANIEEAEQLLASVAQAMELVNNPAYIPTTLRRTQAGIISQIEETVALIRRDINRERELAKAVQEITAATAAGETRGAYRRRDELVAVYPGLERHPDIVRAINQVGERERDQIRVRQHDVTGHQDDPVAAGDSLVVFHRAGQGVPGVTGETVAVLALGSVYGLDAGSGEVLWRRFVGHDATLQPQRFGEDLRGDVLVSQVASQELLRLEARTGQVVWRTPIGEPFHTPVVWREQVFVPTLQGRVWNLDVQKGNSLRQTDLQQTVQVTVGADSRLTHLYQVGESDNLYVLATDSMECRQVYYLGHRQGTILAQPRIAGGFLFLVMNSGADYSYLHVLRLEGDGRIAGPAQPPMRLPGHVLTSPVLSGRRMVVTTTVGAIHVLELNPQQDPPVTQDVSPQPPSRTEPRLAFALLDQATLWVGDERLVRYDIQAAQAQLSRRWVEFNRDAFTGPLQRVGPAVVHVRRVAEAPGVRVTAVDGETGKIVFWQTDLAVPSLTLVAHGDGSVTSLSALGSAVHATPDGLERGLIESAGEARAVQLVYDSAQPLPDGRYVVWGPAARVLFFNPRQPDRPMRQLRLNVPEKQAATSPLPLGEGLLVPQLSGQIALLDLATGDHQVLPFQPELQAGTVVRWWPPAPLAAETREFVVADNRQQMFRVGVVPTGRPHLAALEKVGLEEHIVSGIVAPGPLALTIGRRSDADVLLGFRLPRLALELAEPLAGRVDWGPRVVGDMVLVAGEQDGLVCFGPDGARRWTSPLPHGPVAGVAEVDGDLIVTSAEGVVWRLSGADGTERSRDSIDEPIGGDPVRAGSYLWVAGVDGTLHRLPFLE